MLRRPYTHRHVAAGSELPCFLARLCKISLQQQQQQCLLNINKGRDSSWQSIQAKTTEEGQALLQGGEGSPELPGCRRGH